MTEKIVRLEVSGPLATCGSCRFTTALDGDWLIFDGVLTFRCKDDPLTRRGPSIDSCGECGAKFTQLETDGAALPQPQYKLIKSVARRGSWKHQISIIEPGGDPDDYL